MPTLYSKIEELCERLDIDNPEREFQCILNGWHSPCTVVLNLTKQHICEIEDLYEFLSERLDAVLAPSESR